MVAVVVATVAVSLRSNSGTSVEILGTSSRSVPAVSSMDK